jgi:hypothetical protein
MSGAIGLFFSPYMPSWRGQGKLTPFLKFGCEVRKVVGRRSCEAFRGVDADASI